MSPLRHKMLLALAAVSLGLLGWDAFAPRPAIPPSIPVKAPANDPTSTGSAVPARSPQFTHLTADRVLMPGQRLTVHGRVTGLTQTNPATISLEGPDGRVASAELQDAGDHEATFTLQHPTPAIAPGSFSWILRLNATDDPIVLGVHVGDPNRPRVLLLLDHPSVEGSRLQRWLTEAGSPVTSRTRVSADRHRIASFPGSPVPLERLDAPSLASFDGVVAHANALDRLSPDEQQSLEKAIREEGLGLLILGPQEASDDGASERTTPGTPSVADARRPSKVGPVPIRSPLVAPWLRQPDPAAETSVASRETRIHLFNDVRLDSPVSVLASDLVVPPAGQVLAQDPQGRPLVAGRSLGRGRWACSLVLDSWRWRQQGQEGEYARFWSTLLSALARPAMASTGAWTLSPGSLPVFVDQPLSLVWSGSAETPPPSAEVRALGATDEPAVALNLNRDPVEPSQGRVVFWPMHPGWHTIRALPAGPTFDFYVQPSHALPGVRAQQQRDATQRTLGIAANAPAVEPTIESAAGARPWTRWMSFLAFIFSVACLWTQRADPAR